MLVPEPIPDLLKAVNEASGKALALWITFLTVDTYLAISIGTTTHRQLLLGGPVKLPLLGVDLPLFVFYEWAPPLFVVLHLYVLVQLYLLALLLREFDDELRNANMIEQDRRRIRSQLDTFAFTQFLIGMPQDLIARPFLRLVVWLSLVVGPICLLLGFLLRFLPYHSVTVTHLHQLALLADLVLLTLVWPKMAGSRSSVTWRRVLGGLAGGFFSVGLLALSVWIPAASDEMAGQGRATIWLERTGLLSPHLDLSNEQLVEPDSDKLARLRYSFVAAYRDFRNADFKNADLRKADLTEANLTNAELDGADLTGAHLKYAHLTDASLKGARLVGADLSDTDLTGADFAGITRASALLTKLDPGFVDILLLRLRAYTVGADLTDADITGANLTGTDLSNAKVSQQQLDTACGDEKTRLPADLKIKPCALLEDHAQ